jgi:excisionase family DNA binding protein
MLPDPAPPKLAYGIADAVQATSVGRSLLYEEIRAGKLRTFKVGARTLIAADDLTAWLAAYRSAHP